MRKAVSYLWLAAMMSSLVLPAAVQADSDFTKKEYSCYMGTMDAALDEKVPLYFQEGAEDLPYIEVGEAAGFLKYVQHDMFNDTGYDLTIDVDGDQVKIMRENGYYMLLDYEKNTLGFSDYDAFIHGSGNTPLLDTLSSSGFNLDGEAELFYRDPDAYYDRYGDCIEIKLSEYNIDLPSDEGLYFVPLQTISDFLMSPSNGYSLLFNGKALLMANAQMMGNPYAGLTDIGEYYYSAAPTERSQKLAEFTYNELCLALDYQYGLKDAHNVDKFDQLFWQMGIDEKLKSTDPREADEALSDFINYTLDDLHSGFSLPSWMTGRDFDHSGEGFAYALSMRHDNEYRQARQKAYPDGLLCYEEVGNTAYITFDEFIAGLPFAYYMDPDISVTDKVDKITLSDMLNFNPDPNERDLADSAASESQAEGPEAEEEEEMPASIAVDTERLIIEAHKRVTRENSPIENVVIDLSCNGGGEADAAIFALGWFMGNTEVSSCNTFTGALSSAVYRSDVNLDRKFDDSDTVCDKHLYCLISPSSFSCGNLLPSVFKNSQDVTLIGKTSGGGSCVVRPLSTASGTLFQISGPNRLAFTKNGSFYNIDQGMEPDVYIDDIDHYYDREALTEFINNIY